MLSSFDDFPVHQTPFPVARTGSSDLNHYDRYFFNGYDTAQADGRQDHDGLFFALAMGLYPNRHVADAAFSVVLGGRRQVSVHASRRAPDDRRDANEVGPIRVEVVAPLDVLRLTVDAPEHGLRADLVFRSRSRPLEEPHFFHQIGNRVLMDSTRLTQFGRWEGWIEVEGRRRDVSPDAVVGSRDRSWGVRPVGERGATGAPVGAPQYCWLWAPVSFDTFCTHFDVNELASGRRWHDVGFVVPDGAEGETVREVDHRVRWRPGTRWMAGFELDLVGWDGSVHHLTLEPLYDFMMLGIGYGHPEWGHGVWKGELEVGGEAWDLPVADPMALHHVHVQTVSRAHLTGPLGERTGIGILETLVIGPHEPTGLTGILDPAR